jgi:hypothetical protein
MNISTIDLGGLVTLWKVSDGNPPLKLELENELQQRISQNFNFSREAFFEISKVKNHAIGVSFIPTSDAFREYGENVTIDMLLTDDEMKEMIINYSSKPPVNSQGWIRCKVLVKDGLNDDQIKALETTGFHTRDVFEILHL